MIYIRCDEGMPMTEPSKIEFEFDSPNIDEFKINCIRMAFALGYHPTSIESAFGNIEEESK